VYPGGQTCAIATLDAPTAKAVVIATIRVRIVISLPLFFVDDFSHRIHGFADTAAKVAFGVLGFALAFEMAVSDNLASLLLNLPNGLLYAAFYALSVHHISPFNPCLTNGSATSPFR
jgi:uncharacterized membrane protein AbrB (regulator of aidB expression)